MKRNGILGPGLLAKMKDPEIGLVARCPVCEREEEFDEYTVAGAWLNGHILEEHPGELPPLGGSGEST